ncbi:MAG: C39 family peptidase [Lactobacillaceae bacterium]|jgi:uncharacterized protein YjdB|nr:C39 family peptidase [Lactobacillaceae bacterium]
MKKIYGIIFGLFIGSLFFGVQPILADETTQPATSSSVQTATENKSDPQILYASHVQNIGWQNYVELGNTSGTTGRGLQLEAVKIKLNNAAQTYAGGISYQSHIENIGWQNAVTNDNISGTSGRGLRLEAIKINLTGELATKYDIYYRVHAQNLGWLDWAKNGANAGTAGLALRLEALQIKIVAKNAAAPGGTARPYASASTINYQTHIENIGWQGLVSSNQVSGTTGRGLRIEGLKINLANNGLTGAINYQSHVQNIGWQSAVSNGAMSGTTGRGLRIEAINIRLSGEVANQYDIYYRVHIQDKGWLGWAKNGTNAGSMGIGKRLEALQIRLVIKGDQSAPGLGTASVSAGDFKPQIYRPTYFSQLDGSWSSMTFNGHSMGASGCVPTSLAMVLNGSFRMNVSPVDVAHRMDGLSSASYGATGRDLVNTAQSYGRSVEQISSEQRLAQVLQEGYPVIMFENVGIGHAIAVYGYSNGNTETFDPYNCQFFNGWVGVGTLFNRPSADPADWDAGRPVFVIR